MLRETVFLTLLLHCGCFETNNIIRLTRLYETNLNTSITLERDDQLLRNSWELEFQVKRINVSTKYRLQMTKHRAHSFQSTEANKQWSECLYVHRRQIRKTTKDYYKNESDCLTNTSAGDKDRSRGVDQLEKEIRKWRRSFRYLVNRCNVNHPADKEAADACLVENMEQDNYSQVIQRLIVLKLDAMGQLFLQLTTSIKDLEVCLKTQLSSYLDSVRMTMDALNKCYALKTQ